VERTRSLFVILFIALATTAVVSLTATRRAESSDAGRIGRYQLAAGCYDGTVGTGMPGKGDGIVPRRGIFRIDTATGDTWVLIEHIDTTSVIEDKYDRQWVSID